MKTKTWTEIKDEVYGKKGTVRRDTLERESASFQYEIVETGFGGSVHIHINI